MIQQFHPYTYPEKTTIQNNACILMFTATLFTVARTSKQPKCPLTEWIKKMWYIYTMEYFSAIKNEIMPTIATWMDTEIIILSEVRKKHII